MGCKVTDTGIVLQFYRQDNKGRVQPDGIPVHGKHAALFGEPRKKKVPKGPKGQHDGSDDWLTLIAVADSQEKLDAILHSTKVTKSIPQTSHSSHLACIEVHLGEIRQSFKGRTTIASGPVVAAPPKKPVIHVVHVKVLPEATVMDETHPFYDEFSGGAIFIQ